MSTRAWVLLVRRGDKAIATTRTCNRTSRVYRHRHRQQHDRSIAGGIEKTINPLHRQAMQINASFDTQAKCKLNRQLSPKAMAPTRAQLRDHEKAMRSQVAIGGVICWVGQLANGHSIDTVWHDNCRLKMWTKGTHTAARCAAKARFGSARRTTTRGYRSDPKKRQTGSRRTITTKCSN